MKKSVQFLFVTYVVIRRVLTFIGLNLTKAAEFSKNSFRMVSKIIF